MESIRFQTKYIDTSGVYDSNEGETQNKINSDLQFVDNLDIRTPLMYLCDVGYKAVQGLCCVKDRYIIVGRYKGTEADPKDLMVFDIVTRKVIKSNIFFSESAETGKNVELGHLSSITYVRANGTDYLYIPRSKSKEINDRKGDILRFTIDLNLKNENNENNENFGNISLDGSFKYVAPESLQNGDTTIPYIPLCLAYAGGDFYYIASTTKSSKCYIYKISNNFNQTTLAFRTTFDGLSAGHFARQGFTSDGKYLYFSLSSRLNVAPSENETGHQRLMRSTQEIIITDLNGTVVKSLSFPRGEYGEIEDIDLITPDGSTTPSIVIACNRNDGNSNFAPVYACPLYRNSKKSFYLLTQDSEGSLLRDSERYNVYCDSSPCYIDTSGNVTEDYNVLNSNPFATGLIQDKFTSIPAAIGYIKKLGFPVTLYISGKHGDMTYRGLRGINFVFDGNDTDGAAVNTEVGDITIADSYGISLSFVNGATHGTLNTGNSILYGEGSTAMDAKADKVANATNGNFAALDANGNLTDSGHKHSDYLSTSDYNPDAKTSSMTKAVGKDANGKLWTEPVESSEVVSATENWLSENITQETGYVIDDSLSTTGAAADAKATGDELSDLKSAVFDWTPVNLKIGFTQGGINSSGQSANSNNYARSEWFDAQATPYKIVPQNGCKIWAFYYTLPNENNYANIVDEITDAATLKKGFYVRLVAGNAEGTAFSSTEGRRSFIAYEYSPKKQVEDVIDAICSSEAEALKYAIGSNSAIINAINGSTSSMSGYSRTDFVDVTNFDYIIFSNVQFDASTTQFGAAFYSAADVNTFISGVCADILADVVSYKPKVVKLPDGAKYARFTLLQSLDGFTVKGIRKKPLSGLYLSLLGDSMSAGDSDSPAGVMKTSAGGLYTPAGNNIYYNGSRGGVKNISEMWWKRLCNATGMIPLVIDAWSGSSICYNYAQNDSSHLDTQKIPMCSAMRTSRLSKDGHDPDIIIIAGGGNDWSYAAAASGSYRATTPIGAWDGHAPVNPSAIDSGDSTFMESYAYMIKRLRSNYPHAIIVASTVWRSVGRGSFDPATPTATSEGLVLLNAVGNSTQDYSNAIERVCKIMDVPLINVADIGITYENAYPTYVQDNATTPTHTNPIGQAIIARRYIEELPRLVKQFK